DPWWGVSGSVDYYYPAGGALAFQLLEAASRQKKLDALSKEVRQLLPTRPGWRGGKALLALLQVRQGKTGESRQALRELLRDKKNPIPAHVCTTIGMEVEKEDSLQDLAVTLYEQAVLKQSPGPYRSYSFEYGPFPRLLALYQKAGRNADGRALCLKCAEIKTAGTDPYTAYSQA